ncbi:MAG: ribonuclease R [Betaproteobacteria bacterium]|nr:MAG: ribonuclease R [Betaproteobacteria bacterium]
MPRTVKKVAAKSVVSNATPVGKGKAKAVASAVKPTAGKSKPLASKATEPKAASLPKSASVPKTHKANADVAESSTKAVKSAKAVKKAAAAALPPASATTEAAEAAQAPAAPPNSVLGTIIGHPDGFGFVKLDQGGDDMFLSEDAMRAVLHGDRVAVQATGFTRDNKATGEVVAIIQRANHRVVGKLRSKDGVWFVVASERRINQDVVIPQNKLNKAALDQIVVAAITRQPTPYDDALGEIIEIVGDEDSSDIELEIAIRKHNLPYIFSPETLKEAAAYGDKVTATDRKGRIDLRDMALVTIDGETAKDFDDAVYAEKSGKGFRLVVAIADVSHYVKLQTALDADARLRTTSVYFPRRVIPMLPEALSNELCSLRPNVDRMCMVCDMQIDSLGTIKSYDFYAAVMNSKARLTYTEVAAKLPDLATAKPKAGSIDASLKTLHALYQVFREARVVRGALDFEGQEAVFTFNDDGSVATISPAKRNDAHKLIEEMMLAANVCAAQFLANAKQPLLYRVHDVPLPEKLTAVRETLSLRGLTLGGGERPEPKDYATLIEQTRDRIDAPALHTLLLRSLPQAIYTPKNGGHFGLAFEEYGHFTSPIRRYPDLLVHRGIKAVIAKKKYVESSWDQLGEMCSANERRADIASREVTQFLKAKYLESKLGEEFNGTISGVVPFGVFVTLDETFADGLIHATSLPRDYYQLGRDKVTLEGQRSGFTLSLGERVTVKIASVNADNGKVDFEYVGRAAAKDAR